MSYTDFTQLQEALLSPWERRQAVREFMWDAVFAHTEKGHDIHRFGDDRHLLNVAIRDGLPGVLQRLLGMGLDPAKLDKEGWNAMHLAAYVCSSAKMCMVLPVELLTGWSALGSTPLHFAVRMQNVQAVQWMLEQPCCPVEAKNGIGDTALDSLWEADTRPKAMAIRAAFAARKRWTALRAVWVGAVITYAK